MDQTSNDGQLFSLKIIVFSPQRNEKPVAVKLFVSGHL